MVNVMLVRVLFIFLIVYVVHMIAKRYSHARGEKRRNEEVRKREYTDYDEKEWQKIKDDLSK